LGVAAMRSDQAFDVSVQKAKIIDYRSSGNWAEALACYELMLQQNQVEDQDSQQVNSAMELHCGLLDSFMHLGHFETALTHASGLLREKSDEWHPMLHSYRAQAAWRIGCWDELLASSPKNLVTVPESFEDQISVLFAEVKRGIAREEFNLLIDNCIMSAVGKLRAISENRGLCPRTYENILHLHCLRDIELSFGVLNGEITADIQQSQVLNRNPILSVLERRFQSTQSSVRVREPLLSIRRSLLRILSEADPDKSTEFQSEISHTWVSSAQFARESGNQHLAFSALLQANKYTNGSELHIQAIVETAKLKWDQAQFSEAVVFLHKSLDAPLPENSKKTLAFANACLLLSEWMIETARYDTDVVVFKLEQVKDLAGQFVLGDVELDDEAYRVLEESYFTLGQYYDNVYELDTEKRGPVALVDVISNYGGALKNGSRFIFRALPRLLTLWFDAGTKSIDAANKAAAKPAIRAPSTSFKHSDAAINDAVRQLIATIAPFQFLTALPQLTSRICHQNVAVTELLDIILVQLRVYFPHQTLWMMMAVYKSTHKPRHLRCAEVLRKAEEQVCKMYNCLIFSELIFYLNRRLV
jgi:serine/threonine-protein kinase ATR